MLFCTIAAKIKQYKEEEEGLFCFKIVYHGVHYKTDGLMSTINPNYL